MIDINNDKSGFHIALPLSYYVNTARSLSIVVDDLK